MDDTKRRNLPITLLVVLLLLALATVGVGYGLWSETLRINGTVYTGEVDARWTRAGCFEFYPWPDGTNFGEAEGKDVGSWDIGIDPQNDKVLRFAIQNGYPSYAVDCQVHFAAEGTIPLKVRGTAIWPGSGLTNCTVTGGQTKVMTCDQLTVKYYDGIGSQLEPGDELASSMMVHVEQPAAMNSTYEFQVGVCLAQWNEVATEAECFAAAP